MKDDRSLARERLIQLAERIEYREVPLGVGLKNQCWAGVAHEIASSHGATVTGYFGISFAEMKGKIKGNNKCSPEDRNLVMAEQTRRLAETR